MALSAEARDWLRTGIVVVVTVVGGALAFARLDARADSALEKAGRAEHKAAAVETDMKGLTKELTSHSAQQAAALAALNVEVVRMRTVLDERLPKRANPTEHPR